VKAASGMPFSAFALTATAEKAVMIIITDKKRQNTFFSFMEQILLLLDLGRL
jgi:hypothetical protein